MSFFDEVYNLIDARFNVFQAANGSDLNLAVRVYKSGKRSRLSVMSEALEREKVASIFEATR